jgi:hypothetical protein
MKAEEETKTHIRSKDTYDYNLKIYKRESQSNNEKHLHKDKKEKSVK